jgi:hypothetical protein
MNDRQSLEIELPAGNGVGTARAIARAYSAFAEGGSEVGVTPETFTRVTAPPETVRAKDAVLGVPSFFSLGFLRPGADSACTACRPVDHVQPMTRTTMSDMTDVVACRRISYGRPGVVLNHDVPELSIDVCSAVRSTSKDEGGAQPAHGDSRTSSARRFASRCSSVRPIQSAREEPQPRGSRRSVATPR